MCLFSCAWVNDYHVAHLIGDILQPGLDSFGSRDHSGHLGTNNRLICQGLSECLTLIDPFEATLDDVSLSTGRTAAHEPSLVVEVTIH